MSSRSVLAAGALALSFALAPASAAAQPGAHSTSVATPAAAAKAATLHFEKGLSLFQAKQFGQALVEFRASYAAVPSPNSHLYVARCLVATGELDLAFAELEAVLAEAETRALGEPKYVPTRDTARLERDELAGKVALITVSVKAAEPGANLDVAGRRIPQERWSRPFAVKPGAVELVLSSPSGARFTKHITVTAGEKQTVALDPAIVPAAAAAAPNAAPPPTPEPRSRSSHGWMRPAAYAAGGVGVVGIVMFAVGGAMANHTYSTLERDCGGPCPADRAGDVSAGKTQQTVANVGLVLGVVGVATGVTLFVLSRRRGGPKGHATSSEVLVGPGFTGLKGSF